MGKSMKREERWRIPVGMLKWVGKASLMLAQKPKGERVARGVLEEEQSRQRDQPVQRL